MAEAARPGSGTMLSEGMVSLGSAVVDGVAQGTRNASPKIVCSSCERGNDGARTAAPIRSSSARCGMPTLIVSSCTCLDVPAELVDEVHVPRTSRAQLTPSVAARAGRPPPPLACRTTSRMAASLGLPRS